ncbi:MAG TPA: LysE family translocator [Rhodanobacteraceae bacterium]|jgi:threonine/homoserine/homoserine lactone efflux protein|nr:LysE family translocator [Rhodanobacteraceae bacterium]
MTTRLWLAFFITATAAAFVPGPAVLYVVGQAMRHGANKAVAANLGILSGNMVWFAASAVGLATLVAFAAPVFVAIKWIGVAYLTWLGFGAWRDALRGAEPSRRIAPALQSGARMWRHGALLQLANPKAILFFTALLPQFVEPSQAIAPQIFVLAVTSIVCEFFVLAGCGCLAARGGALLVARPRLARVTDAAAGSCLLGAGIGLALAHTAR